MFIEELVIDGFKSYAHRTVLKGFDANFTAITGLNGSGKSNIIDAIAFVLGNKNYAQLRVDNAQNLIYKNGQAGVQKATVTLVFNNKDKTQSPPGYERFDQITVTRQVAMGGHNKYLINGHNATDKRVKMLFRSVQLNIKNPHFMIMQGRITKVLNMKPLEFLGMIEEAAGTKMYDEKKEEAVKEIERKQRKVVEFTDILEKEISPQLAHLSKQRLQYDKWLESKRDVSRLDKFRIAFQYQRGKETFSEADKRVGELTNKMAAEKVRMTELQRDLEEAQKELKRLLKEKEAAQKSGELADLEAVVAESAKSLAKAQAAQKNQEESIKKETAKLKTIKKGIEKIEKSIKDSEASLAKIQKTAKDAEGEREQKKQHLENLKNQLQALAAGVAADEGKNIADLIMEFQRLQATSDAEIAKSNARTKAAQKDLGQLEKELKKSDGDYKKLKQQEEELQAEIAELTKKMSATRTDDGDLTALEEQRQNLDRAVRDIKGQMSELQSRVNREVSFKYENPEPGFDKKRVFGRIAELVTVTRPEMATALNVAAGGRLYNVVVDNEKTGSLLLSKGKLVSSTTFIPLSQIQVNEVSQADVSNAQRDFGKDKVHSAMSLLQFNKEVELAVKFVFGKTLICADSDTASKVTDKYKIRTVTLQGDLFEPTGTLTGGSRNLGELLLNAIVELRGKTNKLNEVTAELQKVSTVLAEKDSAQRESTKLKNDLDAKTSKRELLLQRLSKTDFFQQQQKIDALKKSLDEEVGIVKSAEEQREKAVTRIKELEEQQRTFNKESQMKKTDKDIAQAKKDLEKLTAVAKETSVKENEAVEAMNGLKSELAEENAKVSEIEAELANLQQGLVKVQASVVETAKDHEAKSAQLEEMKRKFAAADSKISEAQMRKDENERVISEIQLSEKSAVHEIEKLKESKVRAEKLLNELRIKHTWIAAEEQFFGKSHSEFDFSKQSLESVTERLRELTENMDALEKQINKKAIAMFEAAQREYDALLGKKKKVEEDKATLLKVIASLDEKKGVAIKEAYEKVNSDFGVIFSKLLPNSSAQLAPEEGTTIFQGLRMKVTLGGVEKETLSELSGGQRSLLALALVLAMLVFKPAPMYILDEIDAALDLSHTQNIGEMIRAHFKQAQFIIISLKEGMFNNASVLFRIQNVNGSSQATRIDNRGPAKGKRPALEGAETRPSKKRSSDAEAKDPMEVDS